MPRKDLLQPNCRDVLPKRRCWLQGTVALLRGVGQVVEGRGARRRCSVELLGRHDAESVQNAERREEERG